MNNKKSITIKDQIELIKDLKRDSFSEYSIVNSETSKLMAFSSIFIAIIATINNIYNDSITKMIILFILFVALVLMSTLIICDFITIKKIRKEISNHYSNLSLLLNNLRGE